MQFRYPLPLQQDWTWGHVANAVELIDGFLQTLHVLAMLAQIVYLSPALLDETEKLVSQQRLVQGTRVRIAQITVGYLLSLLIASSNFLTAVHQNVVVDFWLKRFEAMRAIQQDLK